jgi:ADP-ribose pyrophosphatase
MLKKVPSHAKKVFEGVIFDTYQWEQELFDGSKTIFENVVRQSIAVAIPVVEDKILVIKEQQPGGEPYLSVPAGFLEKIDTDALSGAKRELKEETGLTSNEWELFDTYSLYPRMAVHDFIFIARNCKKTDEKFLDIGEKQLGEYLYTFDEFIDLYDHNDFASFFLKNYLIRAKYDPKYKEELRKRIFGE